MNKKKIYNYLIVGSGPGGCATAHEISKYDKDIIILEKGFAKKDTYKQYSPEEIEKYAYQAGISSTLGDSGLTFTIGQCVGGGSEINSGFYYELPYQIFKKWKKNIADLDYDLIQKNFYQIKKKLKINKIKKEGLSSKILLIGSKKLNLSSEIVPRWIRSKLHHKKNKKIWSHNRFGMSKTYLQEALKKGVKLVENCEVTKILLQPSDIFKIVCINNKKEKFFFCKKMQRNRN